MKDERIEALDAATKLGVTAVDCTAAAGALARGHLSGPTASVYLAEALAGAALLGAECGDAEETVTFRLDLPGAPLGGFLAECTAAGTLRGYTNRKVLDAFDGLGAPKDAAVLGPHGTCEVIRSVPGAILASGSVAVAFAGRNGYVAQALAAYAARSLQRRVCVALAATAGDDGVPGFARGVSVACPPDGDAAAFASVAALFAAGTAAKALAGASCSARTLLKKLGLAQAAIRRKTPLAFACRCSAERARNILAGLPPAERAKLPETVDVTCHMCGRTGSVR